MKYRLPYNDSEIELDLPDGVRIEGTTFPPALLDVGARLDSAIESPEGCSPLSELIPAEGRISILISDITRGSVAGVILPLLLKRLESMGAASDSIEIMISAGMHRGRSREDLKRHLGSEIIEKYPVSEHDACDSSSMFNVGVTSAGTECHFSERIVDSGLVIGIGQISFHYFAGFGGARKLILPGIASESTILANHRLSLLDDPSDGLVEGCRPGNLEDNPVHIDMLEGARLLPSPVFMINTVSGKNGEIVFINGGDIEQSHLSATRWFTDRFSFRIKRTYSTVIASAGGSPRDIDLLQSHKAIKYASIAVDQGGLLLAATACPEGIGSDSYDGSFESGRDAVPGKVGEGYTLNSQTAMSTFDITGRLSVYLRSGIDDETVQRFGFFPWKADYTGFLLAGIDPSDILAIPNAATFLPILEVSSE
ncbi:MAG: nickel-dependent lactate racemase [Bacteroidales bacterium]|nr:nickel-dependent lactate racemase [Candidatus Latescibacterota bacterium]